MLKLLAFTLPLCLDNFAIAFAVLGEIRLTRAQLLRVIVVFISFEFRQTSRLINCKPRCRYALSLNNRQNNSCQNKQQLPRSRCLITSEVTSSRFLPTGSDQGAKNIGCSDEDRPLIVS